MRNAVYHIGTLVPIKLDVESVVEFAKTLFNELHPQFRFAEARIELPSEKAIRVVSDTIGPQPYLTELSLVYDFSKHLIKDGYDVSVEHAIKGRRADLVAFKEMSIIVCEFKIHKKLVTVESIYQLKAYLDLFSGEFPDKRIEGWFITTGGFTKNAEMTAIRFNIRLIDGQVLKTLLPKKSSRAKPPID